MSDEEHHHVHFGEELEDGFGKDNQIIVQSAGEGKLSLHLGFLKLGHRYKVETTIPVSTCQVTDCTELQNPIPHSNCKLVSLSIDSEGLHITAELLAYKENLLKEEIRLENSDGNILHLSFIARVLGRNKGTPLLKNGITCISVELEDESEASDWQGFE